MFVDLSSPLAHRCIPPVFSALYPTLVDPKAHTLDLDETHGKANDAPLSPNVLVEGNGVYARCMFLGNKFR